MKKERPTKSPAAKPTTQWDETAFFAKLASKNSLEEQATARRVYNWALAKGFSIRWGKGVSKGIFTPVLRHQGQDYLLFAVWTTAGIEFLFKYLTKYPAFSSESKQQEVIARFNRVPGVALPEDTFARFPGVGLLALKDPADLAQLFAAFDWLVAEIKQPPGVKTPEELGWPPDYFETVPGSIPDLDIGRPAKGDYEGYDDFK